MTMISNVMKFISISLQSTLMHSLKLEQLSPCLLKKAQIIVEASDVKLTPVQAVILCHFTSFPSCSPVVSPQLASQPDFTSVTTD